METKNSGIVKQTVAKVAEHSKVKQEIPRWIIYGVGILGLLALGYGIIQQFRIMRWSALLKASKIRIIELEAEKEKSVLETTRRLSTEAIKLSTDKIKELDKKIKVIDTKTLELKKTVGRMKPAELKQGFTNEGF